MTATHAARPCTCQLPCAGRAPCPRFLSSDFADDGDRTPDERTTMAAATTVNWERAARAQMHPTQVKILDVLRETGECSPSRAAEELDIRLGNVSYHFRELAKSGLICETRTAPARGALEHFYSLASS